jgi:hypothetical protein
MKKLIILLVVLATSCNQEESARFSMHKYIGDYTAEYLNTFNNKIESGPASIEKINGEYYLSIDQTINIKLDSTTRKNIVHDSIGINMVSVQEIKFGSKVEVLWYGLNMPDWTDTAFIVLEKNPTRIN